MSTVEHEAHSHHLPPAVVSNQQKRAVLFFILADAVFFASMLFTYFYLHALNVGGGWLPKGAKSAPVLPVWLIVVVTLLSAWAYRSAEQGARAGNRSRLTSGVLGGLGLVILAVALMIYQMSTWGIQMSDGSYASVFIIMTGVQLLHLVIVLFLGFAIWNRAGKGLFDNGRSTHVQLVGYFWYWVTFTSVVGALTTFFTK